MDTITICGRPVDGPILRRPLTATAHQLLIAAIKRLIIQGRLTSRCVYRQSVGDHLLACAVGQLLPDQTAPREDAAEKELAS